MIDNSKRFRRILSFKGRATRLEFIVITTMSLLMMFALWRVILKGSKMGGQLPLIIFMGVVVIFLYLCFAVTFRRRHDLGQNGFEATSLFGLECVFRKGVAGYNKYGSDPLQPYEPQLRQYNELNDSGNTPQ